MQGHVTVSKPGLIHDEADMDRNFFQECPSQIWICQYSPYESQLTQQPLVFIKHGLLVGFTVSLLSLQLQIQPLILLPKNRNVIAV